jgi:hypothetical protein
VPKCSKQSIKLRFTYNVFNSLHTEQGAKIFKALHQFLRTDFIIQKKIIKIAFKSSLDKIVITVIFKNNVDHEFQTIYFLNFMFIFDIIPNTEILLKKMSSI